MSVVQQAQITPTHPRESIRTVCGCRAPRERARRQQSPAHAELCRELSAKPVIAARAGLLAV